MSIVTAYSWCRIAQHATQVAVSPAPSHMLTAPTMMMTMLQTNVLHSTRHVLPFEPYLTICCTAHASHVQFLYSFVMHRSLYHPSSTCISCRIPSCQSSCYSVREHISHKCMFEATSMRQQNAVQFHHNRVFHHLKGNNSKLVCLACVCQMYVVDVDFGRGCAAGSGS